MIGGSFFIWHITEGYPVKANRVYPDGWVVKVKDDDVPRPNEVNLLAYPNPFNSNVTITIGGNLMDAVEIHVFDIGGALIKRLPAPGSKVIWDATDQTGAAVKSGIYFVRIHDYKEVKTLKMLFIK
jgi:hypothetical protein